MMRCNFGLRRTDGTVSL